MQPDKDTFAALSEREFKKLKRDSPWIRDDYYTGDEMNNLVSQISEKKGRPVQLSSYTADIDAGENGLLEPLVLYREIGEVFRQTRDYGPLVHQFKKHSQEFKRLYEWHIYTETTEPFIAPVQHHVRKRLVREERQHQKTSLVLSDKHLTTSVQNMLIDSFFQPTTLITTPELVEPLENILDAKLHRLIVFRDTVFFFFQWGDPMPFIFVVAFGLSIGKLSGDLKTRRLAHNNVVTLQRKDIMEFNLEDDEEEAEKRKKADEEANKKKKSKKSRNTVQQQPLSMLKALLEASVEDDEDEDDGDGEEEGGKIQIDKDVEEEPIIEEKIKHINSLSYEKEQLLKPFIYCVRTGHVSYKATAYVKRE